ncbi:TIGR02117 family protein [Sphingobacterium sp. LRF_L2]|uniref:TIGR02117 family protein n=1 Tax=Sphingobacterium sp. LRF_L2 TaxID=3369421 RepID=UPI003F63F6B1
MGVTVKKMIVWVGYFLLGLLLFVLLYFSADFILSRIPSTNSSMEYAKDGVKVYILSNGVHTDVVLPVRNDQIVWSDIFPYEATKGNDSIQNWVAIGWGDKGFYLHTPEWKDLKLKTALVAGLGIGETALHVTYYKQMFEGEYCRETRITPAQYKRLIDYVLQSLEKDSLGRAILISTDAQYNDDDAFYEAVGAYSLFFSCNTWTNNALKRANMPSGIWTVFDKGILRYYK